MQATLSCMEVPLQYHEDTGKCMGPLKNYLVSKKKAIYGTVKRVDFPKKANYSEVSYGFRQKICFVSRNRLFST